MFRTVLLTLALVLVPELTEAIQLHWSSGSTVLQFSEATRCTLVVAADPSEFTLPQSWRLLWVADNCELHPVPMATTTDCAQDVAEVSSVAPPSDPADIASHIQTAEFCSARHEAASVAEYVIDLPAGARGKLKAVAASPGLGGVLQSAEVTFNGGVQGAYPPVILDVSTSHSINLYTVNVAGVGLGSVRNATLGSTDTSWHMPLGIGHRSDASLTATAEIAALMPASMLSLSTDAGTSSSVVTPADEPTPTGPLADVASFLAPNGYRPKDFALFYEGLRGRFHFFYINHNGRIDKNDDLTEQAIDEKNFGHVWSTDLTNWSQPDTTSFSVLQSLGPWDVKHVWAPTLVQRGPLYYLFYTGVDAAGNQSLGYATTGDLNPDASNHLTWNRQPSPVFTIGQTALQRYSKAVPNQFRDPFVFPHPFDSTRYVMYFTAVVDPSITSRTFPFQTLGVLESSQNDITHWHEFGPLFATDYNNTFQPQVESGHSFLHINAGHAPPDSTWYVLSSSSASPKSIRLLSNKHSPIDTTQRFLGTPPPPGGSWANLASLYDYLGNDSRIADWNGTEYLRFNSNLEYLAGFNASTDPTTGKIANPDSSRIWIVRLQWFPNGSAPDFFRIAPNAVTAVGGTPGPPADAGLRLVALGSGSRAGSVALRVDLPAAMPLRLELYDIQGRRSTTLFEGDAPAGRRDFTWDGRQTGGASAPAGIYFAKLTCSSGTRLARALLLQ